MRTPYIYVASSWRNAYQQGVVEVPRMDRPTLYMALWFQPGIGWLADSHETEGATEHGARLLALDHLGAEVICIPASDSPPQVGRISEQECRERAEKFVKKWPDSSEFNDGAIELLVAFASSLGVIGKPEELPHGD